MPCPLSHAQTIITPHDTLPSPCINAANACFNQISNGDVFRWRDLWPKIADCFELEVAQPMAVPLAKVLAGACD